MDPILLQAIAWVFGLMCCVFFLVVFISSRQTKKKIEAEENPFEQEFEKTSFPAKVIDMQCRTEVVGIKNPKNVRSFVIFFELEEHETFTLSVNEEQYGGFEIGQRGILTVVDGELYSFELLNV